MYCTRRAPAGRMSGRPDGRSIRSDRPGSFPWTVLHDRHPALLRQVREGHPYPPDRLRAIHDLEQEIAGVIQPLPATGPEAAQWAGWAAPHLGLTWYEVPFLVAENLFYRKLLAAVGYFDPGPWQGIDPFAPVKDGELAGPAVDGELAALEELASSPLEGRLDALVLSALWGNRADLGFLLHGAGDDGPGAPTARPRGSAGPADPRGSAGPTDPRGSAEPRSATTPDVQHASTRSSRLDSRLDDRLVVDDRNQLHDLLATLGEPPRRDTGTPSSLGMRSGAVPSGRVVLVADNAGRELLPDLVLIDHLLSTGLAADVVLHVKPSPYFVSDATTADVLATLARLVAGPPAARAVGSRLRAAIAAGRLLIRAHPFSVAPFGYERMPADLHAEFASAGLTLLKGDLNYRRLVGDRHRPATSSFADLTAYFPSPVAALRTLKSEVVVGLDAATLAALDARADRPPGAWRISGTHGLVQVRS